MSRLLIYHALLFGSCGYALLIGKRDARIIASLFLLGNYATLALRPRIDSYASLETGVLAVDLLALVGFTYVALISERFWPLWVSGLQLTTIGGHLMKAVDPSLLPLSYAVALRFWSYPLLIILAAAVERERRRSRRDQLGSASRAPA